MSLPLVASLNTLFGVLFLLTTFMMLALRQTQAILHAYVAQALLLAAATVLLATKEIFEVC